MPKTVRNKRASNATCRQSCVEGATMRGICEWYKSMFEKLGWMILAQQKGRHASKIAEYKRSVKRLKMHIENKLKCVEENDRKLDLQIMWKNTCRLMKHIGKDFKQ